MSINRYPLIPANKDSRYQIKEAEKGFYHVKIVEEFPSADNDKKLSTERVQIFSPEGFKGFIANKAMFGFVSEEIIHDPTYVEKKVLPDDPVSLDEPKKDDPKPEPVVKPATTGTQPFQIGRPGKKPSR